MAVTEEQWDLAKRDGAILEEKIAALVGEFEEKHKPIQVNVLTRWRDYRDLYKMAKGGAAQVVYHDCTSCEDAGLPVTKHAGGVFGKVDTIYYSDAE